VATSIDRSGEQVDWSFPRGDTWVLDFQFAISVATTGAPTTGVADLSGSTWLLQVRETHKDANGKIDGGGPLLAAASITTSQQTSGYVYGTLNPAVTTGAAYGKKAYIYDLQQTNGGATVTPVWGFITVRADQSKED